MEDKVDKEDVIDYSIFIEVLKVIKINVKINKIFVLKYFILREKFVKKKFSKCNKLYKKVMKKV